MYIYTYSNTCTYTHIVIHVYNYTHIVIHVHNTHIVTYVTPTCSYTCTLNTYYNTHV